MANVIGICNLHNSPKLGKLTEQRPLGATSFLGRYGLIDFTLSNFSNSGIDRIAILCEENVTAIRDHIRSGNIYINNTKTGYIRILTNEKMIGTPYNTDVNNMVANSLYIGQISPEYAVIAPAHFLMNIDYRDIIKAHEESGAEITVLYTHRTDSDKEFLNCDVVELNKKGEVEKFTYNDGHTKERDISLDIYVINFDLLRTMVNSGHKISSLYGIKQLVAHYANHHRADIHGFEFKGYVVPILSLEHYVKYSFELLDYQNRLKLFSDDNPVYTSTHDTPPALYGADAEVKNSFIANGCIVKGKVENSILSRNVRVHKGAKLKNCIVFTGSSIGRDTDLSYVVINQKVKVKEVKELKGDKDHIVVIGEGENI